MKISVHWHPPVHLKSIRKGVGYELDLEAVPACAGVYVFARTWGDGFEALYVGKANNIRSRLRQHLNNLRLMNHITSAALGKRVVITGAFEAKQGQRAASCLPLVERALIRHFLSEGHDLVNVHGRRLWQHQITMEGQPRRLVPKAMNVAR